MSSGKSNKPQSKPDYDPYTVETNDQWWDYQEAAYQLIAASAQNLEDFSIVYYKTTFDSDARAKLSRIKEAIDIALKMVDVTIKHSKQEQQKYDK